MIRFVFSETKKKKFFFQIFLTWVEIYGRLFKFILVSFYCFSFFLISLYAYNIVTNLSERQISI